MIAVEPHAEGMSDLARIVVENKRRMVVAQRLARRKSMTEEERNVLWRAVTYFEDRAFACAELVIQEGVRAVRHGLTT